MNNIHIIPTDKPSRLFIDIDDNKLKITIPIGGEHMVNQNIYITNSEEIKMDDWYLTKHKEVHKSKVVGTDTNGFHFCKKVILTTDSTLIADGVQAIDDEFLEWFVNNPSCEYVEVIHGLFNTMGRQVNPMNLGENHSQCIWKYKITIPKEEYKTDYTAKHIEYCHDIAMKSLLKEKPTKCYCGHTTYCDCGPLEETLEEELCNYSGLPSPLAYIEESKQGLEEAIEKYAEQYRCPATNEGEYCRHDIISAINFGVKLAQERMYSDEDMSEAYFQGWVTRERYDDMIPDILYPKGLDYEEQQDYAFNLWFQKFKKK